MIVLTLIGTVGTFTVSPFCGVAVYYLFGVLRPQFMWDWALPSDISWSFYVAVATILAGILHGFGGSGLGGTHDDVIRRRRQLSFGHMTVLAFGAWVAGSYVTALNQDVAYAYLIDYAKLFVMFVVCSLLIRTVRQVWILYLIITGALGYIAYEVNFLYVFEGGYMIIFHRGYAGLDNNGAGLMLAMGIPLCFFAWEGIRQWWRWLFLALIPPLIHAVLMSYSRGAMLALIASIPLYFLRSRHRVQLGAVTLAMALLVPVLAGKEIRERFFSVSQYEQDDSANSRLNSWAIGWRIAKEHPVFGVGIRNANLLTFAYGADMEGRTIHSLYIQTAADSGMPALALYLVASACVWLCTRKARIAVKGRDDLDGQRVYAIACGVEGSLVVFWTGAIFLSLETFELSYLLMLLAVQLPVVLAQPAPEPEGLAEIPAPVW